MSKDCNITVAHWYKLVSILKIKTIHKSLILVWEDQIQYLLYLSSIGRYEPL